MPSSSSAELLEAIDAMQTLPAARAADMVATMPNEDLIRLAVVREPPYLRILLWLHLVSHYTCSQQQLQPSLHTDCFIKQCSLLNMQACNPSAHCELFRKACSVLGERMFRPAGTQQVNCSRVHESTSQLGAVSAAQTEAVSAAFQLSDGSLSQENDAEAAVYSLLGRLPEHGVSRCFEHPLAL